MSDPRIIKFPAGTPLAEIFSAIQKLQTPATQNDVDKAVVMAIEAVAQGSLTSDKELLSLITLLIERVNKLEAAEAARFDLYRSLVERQQDLAKVVTKAVDELDKMAQKFFSSKKDVH